MKTDCEICGREFEARRSTDKYCSDECRRRAHYKQMYSWNREHYAQKPAKHPSDRCVFEMFVNCLPEERAHGECRKCGWNPEEKERRRHDEKYRGRGKKAADNGLPDRD